MLRLEMEQWEWKGIFSVPYTKHTKNVAQTGSIGVDSFSF